MNATSLPPAPAPAPAAQSVEPVRDGGDRPDPARAVDGDLLRTIIDNVPGAVFQFRVGPDGAGSSLSSAAGSKGCSSGRPPRCAPARPRPVCLAGRPGGVRGWPGAVPRGPRPVGVRVPGLDPADRAAQVGHWRAVPDRRPDGSTVWNGLMKDATEQVAALTALRESEARYRLLTENATDLIARLTPAGVFVYASPAARPCSTPRPRPWSAGTSATWSTRTTCHGCWRRSVGWRPTARPTCSPTAAGRPTGRTSGASPRPGPSATPAAACPRSSPSPGAPRTAAGWRTRCGSPRGWRRSAGWPGGSPTTSTTCSPSSAGTATGPARPARPDDPAAAHGRRRSAGPASGRPA